MAVALPYPQAQPTPLLGRSAEIEEIVQRLTREHVRLLSLTGPGGVGKTRLALEARDRLAGQFRDGVILVDLSPVREPSLVLPTIAHALGILDSGPYPLAKRLHEYLADRESLLILDTFEQVLPAAEQLPELLAATPGLTMLVTSRVPLRLRWEQILRISLLAVPAPDAVPQLEELIQIPSVALFVERARAQRADFTPTEEQAPLLVQLTRQLDGLPLALELAAGQMNVLPLAVIVKRMNQRVQTLQWDAQDLPDRHRSLQAAIGWSYELLTEAEQRLFRHLGVFVGRVSLNAIDAVAGNTDADLTLDGITALAEKSLILPGRPEDDDPEPAFELLDTVRQYAYEQLEAQAELEAAARAHAQYFLDLAEQADPKLRGRDQAAWSLRLESEHDNLRAALRWLRQHEEPEQALRLAGALGYFWWHRGYNTEALQWLEEGLRLASDADPAIRISALLRAGQILFYTGDLPRSKVLIEEALALAEARQDRLAITQSLTYLGIHSIFAGELSEARRVLQEALRHAEVLQDDYQIGVAHSAFGFLASAERAPQEAAAQDSASLERFLEVGNQASATITRFHLALVLRQLDDLPSAVQLLQDGLQTTATLQNRWHLCLGAEATLVLVGESVDAERRARLLGAREMLVQATGSLSDNLERVPGQSVAGHRAMLEQEGLGAAYRQGRSMPFGEIVTLALESLEEFAQKLPDPQAIAREPARENPLSEREQEVLRLVAEGLISKQIGQQLFLSHRTIDHHLTSIFNKLGVDTRAQAVAVAARDGLL
jgi:predicted ATPase/DNA-binding CsgD family transcriptional regulator